MENPRRKYTAAEQLSLTTQVGGHCPLCDAKLFYEKNGKTYKEFELAHIYPLNPKPDEAITLAGVETLGVDTNHPDNLIPLCTRCHTKFDKPRTRDEYEHLLSVKRELLAKERQRRLNSEYPLEEQLRRIVARLHLVALEVGTSLDLELDPKRLDAKLGSMPVPVKRKIRHAVTDYYQYVRSAFKELEQEYPTSSELIFTQVKAYYLQQKLLSLSQPTIFANVVDWMRIRGGAESLESAEIMASFFVQNCEVFE